ncbi:hypothetical protein THAOC_01523, partial [Thalassiosira oceanica]
SKESSLHGGTIFHDAASKAIYVSNQSRLTAPETILSKNRFEQWLWDLATAKVREYRSNNGVFSAAEFTAACEDDGQKKSFSGVSAQHQNAEAERAIQTIVYWPDIIWSTGLTPMEFLTTVRSDHKDIRRLHVWGCPTFVLDAKLAEDKKIPKFKMRSEWTVPWNFEVSLVAGRPRTQLAHWKRRQEAREDARAAESARRLLLLVPEDIRPHRDPVATTPIVDDSDSDDDSVADDSSPVPVLESEGDLWADHPSVTAGPSTPKAQTPALVEDDSPACSR